MKKTLTLFSLLVLALAGWSQSDPVLLSYEIDTLCNFGSGDHVINIQVQDMDADSTTITINSYNTSLYAFMDTDNPVYSSGQTLRTFTFVATAQSTIPGGLNLSDINITIDSHNGSDNLVSETISNTAVYGDLGLNLTFGGAVICENDQPIDLNNYTNLPGGEWTWGQEEHEGHMFDPVLYLEDPSAIFYHYENGAGCSADGADGPLFYSPAILSIIETPSTCTNADGQAQVFITGGTGPYNLYWSTGHSVLNAGSTETITNLSSGVYYANVENSFGCKASIAAHISDSDVALSATPTNPLCHDSYDGSIDLTVSTNGTVTDIFWSNGLTTEDIGALPAGEYAVEVHTDMNCNGFDEFILIAPPRLDVDIQSLTPTQCGFPGNSFLDISTAGGTPFATTPYIWNWSSGQTTEDIAPLTAGVYTCTVTDMNGCQYTWSENVPDMDGPQIFLEKITKSHCTLDNGSIDVTINGQANNVISTVWNTGATAEDMTNASAGSYDVTVTDDGGCVTKAEFTIPPVRPYQPTICLLTVDTSLIYNTLVWEKDISQNVAGFNVYRETTTHGEYELVAQRPYALESFFQDNAASPVSRSWRYYVTTYDDCGIESFPSFSHKTIHCVTQVNGPNTDVFWDKYEGISYSSVDLHRYDDINGWVTIGPALSNTTTSFTDNPTVTAGLDYLVTFNLSNTCTSTKATDYNSSRSNKSYSAFNPGGSTVQLEEKSGGMISIYPNPAQTMVSLYIEFPAAFESIELRDANGKQLFVSSSMSSITEIDLTSFATGVYFVSLISGEQVINHKVIKQ